MGNEKTLLCPFCGKQPIMTVTLGEGVMIACDDQDCPVSPSATGDSVEDAMASWNTRHLELIDRKAILHLLRRIKEHPPVGYYFGELTETFDSMTEAAAALFNEPVEKVSEFYKPTSPRK